jgi:hypothetical protein
MKCMQSNSHAGLHACTHVREVTTPDTLPPALEEEESVVETSLDCRLVEAFAEKPV